MIEKCDHYFEEIILRKFFFINCIHYTMIIMLQSIFARITLLMTYHISTFLKWLWKSTVYNVFRSIISHKKNNYAEEVS